MMVFHVRRTKASQYYLTQKLGVSGHGWSCVWILPYWGCLGITINPSMSRNVKSTVRVLKRLWERTNKYNGKETKSCTCGNNASIDFPCTAHYSGVDGHSFTRRKPEILALRLLKLWKTHLLLLLMEMHPGTCALKDHRQSFWTCDHMDLHTTFH